MTRLRQYDRDRLERFAYENRRELTKAERAMVSILGELGWRFNIEHPKHRHNIILDFMVPQHGLVIEVDGGYHAKRKNRDRERDKALVRRGFIVQRFTNEQVMKFPRKTKATLLSRIKPPTTNIQPTIVKTMSVSGKSAFIPGFARVIHEANIG